MIPQLLIAFGALAILAKGKKKNAVYDSGVPLLPAWEDETEPGGIVPPDIDARPNPLIVASFPGWRRAGGSEVTSDMASNAQIALAQPLGSHADVNGYRLAVEHHRDDRRGWHKGVSVFLPD